MNPINIVDMRVSRGIVVGLVDKLQREGADS